MRKRRPLMGKSLLPEHNPRSTPYTTREARRRQHAFWDPAYESADDPLGGSTSPLLALALLHLPTDGRGQRLVELGCGSGRDLQEFIRLGFEIAAVDLSRPAVRIARLRSMEVARPAGVARPIIDVGDAVEFLQTQPDHSASAIYANLFLTMGFPPGVERAIRRESARVLRPGGWHIFSVRSRADQWFGRGVPIGPATFDLAPDGPPVRFFTEAELRRQARGLYDLVELRTGTEGSGEFERTVMYVVERRRS